MLPKGILFDFDGVVVDSAESHNSAWASAFKELFATDIAPFPKNYAGKSPMVIAEYFCSIIGKEAQTENLFFLKDKHLDLYFKTPKFTTRSPRVHYFFFRKKYPIRYCK